jgi:hypothetical protein
MKKSAVIIAIVGAILVLLPAIFKLLIPGFNTPFVSGDKSYNS